ncbi:MAG: 4Fe-4S dicluster domain-containing protein [Chloroflexi bacterium]|nr:4Fe-4S dicluster domain-containing protein [Chloroflexota bacterium]
MPFRIIETCTACGLCLPTCPIDAITIGDPIYVIDQANCCDFEECLAVCPENAIVPAEAPENSVTERVAGADHLSAPSPKGKIVTHAAIDC